MVGRNILELFYWIKCFYPHLKIFYLPVYHRHKFLFKWKTYFVSKMSLATQWLLTCVTILANECIFLFFCNYSSNFELLKQHLRNIRIWLLRPLASYGLPRRKSSRTGVLATPPLPAAPTGEPSTNWKKTTAGHPPERH